jgi:hypothetical protein
MAGMFGRASPAYDPSGNSRQDRLMLLGATLRDTGNSLRGGEADAVANMQALLAGRQLRAKQQAFMGDLSGQLQPGYTDGPAPTVGLGGQGNASTWEYQPPVQTRAPLNINSPNMASMAATAEYLGVPIDKVLDVLKAQQPKFGFTPSNEMFDEKTGRLNPGMVAPKLGEGIIPERGPGGELLGASAVTGYADAAAGIEGAKTGAQERAKAPYGFQTVTGPDGRPRTISNETAALLGANGGIISSGPSAAQLSADKIAADNAAQGAVELPKELGAAQTALDVLKQIRDHPGRKLGTGASGVLPGIPGTQQMDFITLVEQAKGGAFLTAIGTLKGTGQITEIEGAKGTAAITRMNRAQTEQGFLKALDDYEAVIKAGAARAQQRAGQPPAAGRWTADQARAELARRRAAGR